MLWRSSQEPWHKGRVRRVRRSIGIMLWDYKYRDFPLSVPSFAQRLLSYTPRCVRILNVPCACAQLQRGAAGRGCPTAGTCPSKHDLLARLPRGPGREEEDLLCCSTDRNEWRSKTSPPLGSGFSAAAGVSVAQGFAPFHVVVHITVGFFAHVFFS